MTFDALDLVAPSLTRITPVFSAAQECTASSPLRRRDLSRFAPLAGSSLEGEARIAADLDGAPRYGALAATLDAHATRLATAYSSSTG